MGRYWPFISIPFLLFSPLAFTGAKRCTFYAYGISDTRGSACSLAWQTFCEKMKRNYLNVQLFIFHYGDGMHQSEIP